MKDREEIDVSALTDDQYNQIVKQIWNSACTAMEDAGVEPNSDAVVAMSLMFLDLYVTAVKGVKVESHHALYTAIVSISESLRLRVKVTGEEDMDSFFVPKRVLS